MEPLQSFASVSESARARTYLDSGLSPIRTTAAQNNNNATTFNNSSYYSSNTTINHQNNNNTNTNSRPATGIINASSTTFSSPLYGPISENSHPTHISSATLNRSTAGAAAVANTTMTNTSANLQHNNNAPGQGSRNIRAMINTLRETSVLLGETPAALNAIEAQRQRELTRIEENLPTGSYINGHYAAYDNETPSLMLADAATSAVAAAAAIGSHAAITAAAAAGAGGAAAGAGGLADFLDADEDAYGNIARDIDRELPMSFLSAAGLPDDISNPDPTRVAPQLIRDIVTHTAARQRLHLRLFFDNLQDFLAFDDTTNHEWEMLLATLFVLARRRGGLSVLQRRYHEEVSELSFDILFTLLGSPEVNPKYPQVLTALNSLMRRLGCRKEEEMLEQFFARPEREDGDATGSPTAAKNNKKSKQQRMVLNAAGELEAVEEDEDEEGDDDEPLANMPRMRSAIKDVDGVYPVWETDDDVDAEDDVDLKFDDDDDEDDKKISGKKKDSPLTATNDAKGPAITIPTSDDDGNEASVVGGNATAVFDEEGLIVDTHHNQTNAENAVVDADPISAAADGADAIGVPPKSSPSYPPKKKKQSKKEAQLLELLADAAAQLPAHPFYYSLDSLTDPADRGDLTEDEFLLLEEWFRSLPATISLFGDDPSAIPANVAADNAAAAAAGSSSSSATAAVDAADEAANLSLIDTLRLVGAAMTRVKQSQTFSFSRGNALFIGRGYLGSRYISDKTLRNFQALFAGVVTPNGKRLPGGTCTFYQLVNFLFPTCPEKTLLRRCQQVVLSDHVVTVDKLLHPNGPIQRFLREEHIKALMAGPLALTRYQAEERLYNVAAGIAVAPMPPPPPPPAPVPAPEPVVVAPPAPAPAGKRTASASRSRPPTPSARRPSATTAASRRPSLARSPTPTSAGKRRPSALASAPAPAPAPVPAGPAVPTLPQLVLSPEATEQLRVLLVQERARYLAGHKPHDAAASSIVDAPNTTTEVVVSPHSNSENPPTTTDHENGGAQAATAEDAVAPAADPNPPPAAPTVSSASPLPTVMNDKGLPPMPDGKRKKAVRPMTPHGTTTHTAAQVALIAFPTAASSPTAAGAGGASPINTAGPSSPMSPSAAGAAASRPSTSTPAPAATSSPSPAVGANGNVSPTRANSPPSSPTASNGTGGAPLNRISASVGLGAVSIVAPNSSNNATTPVRAAVGGDGPSSAPKSSSAEDNPSKLTAETFFLGFDNKNKLSNNSSEGGGFVSTTAVSPAIAALLYVHKVSPGRSPWAVEQRLRLLQRTDWGAGTLNKELQCLSGNGNGDGGETTTMAALNAKAAARRESFYNSPLKLQSPLDTTTASDIYPAFNRGLLKPVGLTVSLAVALLEWFHSLDWTHSGAITVQQFVDLAETQQQLKARAEAVKAKRMSRRASRALNNGDDDDDDDESEDDDEDLVAFSRSLAMKNPDASSAMATPASREGLGSAATSSPSRGGGGGGGGIAVGRIGATASPNDTVAAPPYVIYCGDWRIHLDELLDYKQGSVTFRHHQDRLTRKAPTHQGNRHVASYVDDAVSAVGNTTTATNDGTLLSTTANGTGTTRRDAQRKHLPPTLLITLEDILRYLFLELESPPPPKAGPFVSTSSAVPGAADHPILSVAGNADDDKDTDEKKTAAGGVAPAVTLPFSEILHQPFVRSRLDEFSAVLKAATDIYVASYNGLVNSTHSRNEGYKQELLHFVQTLNSSPTGLVDPMHCHVVTDKHGPLSLTQAVEASVVDLLDDVKAKNNFGPLPPSATCTATSSADSPAAGNGDSATAIVALCTPPTAVPRLPLTAQSVPYSFPALLQSVVNTNPAGDIDTAVPYLINAPRRVEEDGHEQGDEESKQKTKEESAGDDNGTAAAAGNAADGPREEAEDSPPPPPRYIRAPILLQFAATERTRITAKRTLTARHTLVKQYKNGRRRELVAEAMRAQFDFIQKNLQMHVPKGNATFLKAPPVFFDLYGLSVNDTILDLSYFAARPERRLQVRELLVALDQSGIPARYFVKEQRLYPSVPVPSGFSGSSAVVGANGIYGSGLSGQGEYAFCGPIHVYRDFAFCSPRPQQHKHWPTGQMQCVHVVTNIPVKSGIKFRFHFEGYNFGANCPINTIVVGSADKRFESVGTLEYYGWPDRWDQDTVLNKGNGFESATPYISDGGKGFVCFELAAKSLMHVGFGVSCWMVNHGYGGKHQLTVKFVHQLTRL